MDLKTVDYLSHTADVRMRLKADSVKELFEAALEGMNKIIMGREYYQKQKLTITENIALTSQNLTTLLIEFLNEVLTRSHTHKALFGAIQINQLSETEISASVSGYHVEEFHEDIKAVTYHEADVHRNNEKQYETIILFDT